MERNYVIIGYDDAFAERIDALDREIFKASPWGSASVKSIGASEAVDCFAVFAKNEKDTFCKSRGRTGRGGAESPAARGELIAYIIFSLGEEAEIYRIAVREDKRRLGIAGRLMRAVIERSRSLGTKRLLLEVRETNLPAIALYEGLGFKTYHRRKDYYKEPLCDALMMDMEL